MPERTSEKQRYLVVVNRKWLLMVDAFSMGGAEHAVLDRCRYIEQCQAFERNQANLLFEMFPDVEISLFPMALTFIDLLELDDLITMAQEMMKKAESIIKELHPD
jgi:hypothetical protein